MTASLLAGILVTAADPASGSGLSAEAIYGGIAAVVAAGTLAASVVAGKRMDIRAERVERREAEAERKAAEEKAAKEEKQPEKQPDADRVEDPFEARRQAELERMWRRLEEIEARWDEARGRVTALERTVGELETRDRQKQGRIEDQETLLGQLKALVHRLVDRIDYAWEHGHEKPTLTSAERALLDEVPQRH